MAETKDSRPVQQHPVTKKLGDFCIDVAKLIVGGVILSGLMKQDIDFWFLVGVGTAAVVAFLALGLILHYKSN